MMRKTSDLNGMTDIASADFFKLVARFKKVVNTLVKRILFVLPILLSIIVIYVIYIFDFVQRNNVFIRIVDMCLIATLCGYLYETYFNKKWELEKLLLIFYFERIFIIYLFEGMI